jgi:hypothetical protein
MTTRCIDMIQLYFTTPMITVPTGRIVLATKSSQTMHALLSFYYYYYCYYYYIVIKVIIILIFLFIKIYWNLLQP